MTLPNFLIIGGVKCGTSSLYQYLKQHPDVFMPARLKEARFFCCNGSSTTMRINVKTIEEYTRLFDEVTNETAVGEASPQYLSTPHAASAIKRLIPDAKLIASLRNPVDRAHSAYLMCVQEHGMFRGLTFQEALKADPRLMNGYAPHLERYYGLFPRANIRIVIFEEIAKDAAQVVKEIFGFLQVDPGVVPDVSDIFNPGGVPKSKLLFSLLTNRITCRLKAYFPEFLVKSMGRIRKANLQSVKLTLDERTQALALFQDDIAKTEDLVGLDLSAWTDPSSASSLPRTG